MPEGEPARNARESFAVSGPCGKVLLLGFWDYVVALRWRGRGVDMEHFRTSIT